MNRVQAVLVLLGLAVLSAAGLVLPPPWAALLAAASVLLLRRGRVRFLLFAASLFLFNAVLFAWLVGRGASLQIGPLSLSSGGALLGVTAATRLVAVIGANLAALSWAGPERLLDGLRLPAPAAAFCAAVVLLAHDLGRDFSRLVAARRLDGAWPRRLPGRVREGVRLLPPLLVVAVRRAQARREALRLAGHDTPPSFAPLVAVTAVAIAGRLALLGLPNIALTYVAVFLGGLLFGPLVGAGAGFLSMALTDLLLTGVYLAPFANAPAMAILGLLGGMARGFDFSGRSATERWAGLVFAFCAGLAGTMLFSAASDAATWLLVPEYRATPGSLRLLVLAGLAFNVAPAVVNGFLFAASAGPVTRAFRAIAEGGPDASAGKVASGRLPSL